MEQTRTNSPTTNSLTNDKWPDFYAVLNAQPEWEEEALRRAINDCYQKANSQSDHRDLAVRFYNQVLSQKVLPACRRVLLNPQMRALYNEQLQLHRTGALGAVSYQTFVVEITHTKSTCLLDDNELSMLPSVSGEPSEVRLPALHGANSRTETETVTLRVSAGGEAAPTTIQSVEPAPASAKKAVPWAALVGIGILLLGGAGWALMNKSGGATEVPTMSATTVDASSSGTSEGTEAANAQATVPMTRMTLNSLVTNPDFEDADSGSWIGLNKGVYIENVTPERAISKRAPRSGTHKLIFWNDMDDENRVTQRIKNLPNGTYTLSAWMRRSVTLHEAYMFVNQYGGPTLRKNVPQTSEWEKFYIKNIKVTNGDATIGFYCKNAKNNWLSVDAVEFYAQ